MQINGCDPSQTQGAVSMTAAHRGVVHPISTQLMKTSLPQQWANRINEHSQKAVESILAMGRDLIAAKKQLGHGGWQQMFAGHPQVVAKPLRFSPFTAQRLMAIAHHAILPKAAHALLLPPSWTTLYELTKVPDETLRQALSDGRISPEMQRRDVRQLYVVTGKVKTRAHPTVSSVTRLSQTLQREVMTLPVDEAEGLIEQLESLLRALQKRVQARRTKEDA
jgi:hypothetical protein